jgi:two-component system response regulator PilR (NtrC family)
LPAPSRQAREFLAQEQFALCLTDMRLPDGEGMDLVRHIAEHHRDLPVAVITAYGSMDNAVAALKAGAFDYLAKPVSIEQLRALVRSALELPRRSSVEASAHGTDALVGDAPAMTQVREMIAKLARSGAPVHIQGESGSGKERAARLIHELGPRAVVRSLPSIAARFPKRWSSRNSSATPRAPSPAPTPIARDISRRRAAARCSSTKWATCRCRCR